MLSLFRRRPKLPAVRRPPLDRDERVLAWAEAPDGQVVVATNQGLWLPGLNRVGWHEVHKAAWSGSELRITPAQVCEEREEYFVVADQPVLSYVLDEPGELPHHVRARVTRSVAYTTHHPVPGVRIVARRVSGVNGLTWTARYDAGVDSDEPAVIESTDALVTQARESATPSD